MIFDEIEVRLKDGRTAILRPPREEDAGLLIDYLRAINGETRYMAREPEEVRIPPERELEIIDDVRDDPRGAMLLAFVDGKHAGNCSFSCVRGTSKRYAHRCTVGVGLYQRYCGLGLGRAMMEHALAMARDCGYEQAELEVAAENAPALALYEKLGFETYGRRPHDMKYTDGSYVDMLLMIKRL